MVTTGEWIAIVIVMIVCGVGSYMEWKDINKED